MGKNGVMTKDEAARDLIEWNFKIDPDLLEVYRILSDNEEADDEPIKLLEVNEATPDYGEVQEYGFPGTEDAPYWTVFAEITPREFEMVRSKPEMLPEGWSLSRAERFVRPAA